MASGVPTNNGLLVIGGTLAQWSSTRFVIGKMKPPGFESLLLLSIHRLISLSQLHAPTGSGQLSLSSLSVDKSSYSFVWDNGKNFASVGLQVQLCDTTSDVSFRGAETTVECD